MNSFILHKQVTERRVHSFCQFMWNSISNRQQALEKGPEGHNSWGEEVEENNSFIYLSVIVPFAAMAQIY